MVGHGRSKLRMRFAPEGDMKELSSIYQFGDNMEKLTYVRLVALDNGDVLAATRADNNGKNFAVFRIIGIDSNSPTFTFDLLSIANEWQYPRYFEKQLDSNGQEIVLGAWNSRSDSQDLDWFGCCSI